MPSPHRDRDPASPTSPQLPYPKALFNAQLTPSQLRAIAQWLRTVAQGYEHQAPGEVSHSFRIQAQQLDQLARQQQPPQEAIKGTLMSAEKAYWITATGQCFSQVLTTEDSEQSPASLTAEAPATCCSETELRQAYNSRHFSIILGDTFLAERLGPRLL